MSLKVERTTGAGFVLHDEDEWYAGDLVDMEETEGQYGPGLKWVIELDDDEPDDEGNPRETWAYCSQTLSPKSKLWDWIKGIDPNLLPEEDGDILDLEPIIGIRVEVMFEHVDKVSKSGEAYIGDRVYKIRAEKKAARRRSKTEDTDEVTERRKTRRSKSSDYGPDEAPF